MSATGAADDAPAPVIRVVSGRPDAGELAALVAVLVARAGAGSGTGSGAVSAWGAPASLVRPGVPVRAGGWGGASATLRG